VEVARKVAAKVIYNNKDITSEITPYLSRLEYSDKEEGASDELTLTIDNASGIWFEDWYPTQGDTIQAYMGYEDEMIDCGLYQVDEITVSGAPDIIEIKAISAGITKELRTRNNKAFENLTLLGIAKFFCNKHNLTLIDGASLKLSQIYIDRKTQEEKTDLAFLSELAKEYGFLFSIKGDKLVFVDYYTLDNAASTFELDKTQLSQYSLTNKMYDTYASAVFKKRDPKKGKIISNEYSDWNGGKNTEELVLDGKASSNQQAEAKVKSGLWGKNKYKESGNLAIEGYPRAISGTNFDLIGLGLPSGQYHIPSSTHSIQGMSTYTTSLEIRKTGTIPKPRRVPNTNVKKEKTQEDIVNESLNEGID
jgi:phage protein D